MTYSTDDDYPELITDFQTEPNDEEWDLADSDSEVDEDE